MSTTDMAHSSYMNYDSLRKEPIPEVSTLISLIKILEGKLLINDLLICSLKLQRLLITIKLDFFFEEA